MFGIIYTTISGKQEIYNKVFRSAESASYEADILNEMYPENRYSVVDLWAATTNNSRSGGMRSLHAKIHRLLRECGVVYYLAKFGEGADYNSHGKWGMVYAHEIKRKLKGANEVVTGYTLNHCFHKLGKGCADRGAEIYWGW